MKTQINKTS